MISRYPDGLTGAALLLLRLSCALVAWPALARLWPAANGWSLAFPAILIALALILGFGSRGTATALAALLVISLFAARGESLLLLLASAGGAATLALLGPGAWSIDAHRFGRRVIRVDTRFPDRGGQS